MFGLPPARDVKAAKTRMQPVSPVAAAALN
jgi:hypothetical protein